MQTQHPDSFRQNILSVPGWFSESESSKFSIPIGNTGIYLRRESSAGKIRETCYEIVTQFGYPEDSLLIKDSDGIKL